MIKESDLRQLIRDELVNIPQHVHSPTASEKPLSTKELCMFLNISEPTVIKWRAKRKIPFLKIGSAYRYDKAAVIHALSEQKNGGSRR